MDLRDVAQNHSSYLVVLILMIIPVVGWGVTLVLGMVTGDVDVIVGVAGTLSVLAIGGAAMTPSFYEYTPYLAVLAYASFLIVPLCRRFFDQKELRSLHVEKIEKAYLTLGMKPDNPALKFSLATMLYGEGMVDAAIAIAASVMDRLPQRLFPEENRHFRAWQAMAVKDIAPAIFTCSKCGFGNKPGDVFCQKCSAPFFLHVIQDPGKAGDINAKFISIWLTLIIAGIAIPAAFLTLPVAIAFFAMVIMIIMCGIILAKAFGRDQEVTD